VQPAFRLPSAMIASMKTPKPIVLPITFSVFVAQPQARLLVSVCSCSARAKAPIGLPALRSSGRGSGEPTAVATDGGGRRR
jgi:hypothetical protein